MAGDEQPEGREEEYRRWRIGLAILFGSVAALITVVDAMLGRPVQLPVVVAFILAAGGMLAVNLPRIMK